MSDAPQTTPDSMVARQLKPTDKGAAGFLKWLKISMPAVYNDILPQVKMLNAQAKAASGNGVGSLGDSGTTYDEWGNVIPAGDANASTSWTSAIANAISAWGQYKLTDAQLDTAKQITQINLQRAQQGLAPLPYDASQLGLAPTVKVGLSGDLTKLAMYGGAGLLLILFLSGRKRA